MTHTLAFELGTEELPPSELPSVLAALAEGAPRKLRDARLGFGRGASRSWSRDWRTSRRRSAPG
jgi:glycyl-tRNA synthetase beta subunit